MRTGSHPMLLALFLCCRLQAAQLHSADSSMETLDWAASICAALGETKGGALCSCIIVAALPPACRLA